MAKWVYGFGGGSAEGNAGDRNLLGGKGANLAEMCGLGLPVPPGFTITTAVCSWYYANGRSRPRWRPRSTASARFPAAASAIPSGCF
jgi:pyruvate,orthophosphate dikinase